MSVQGLLLGVGPSLSRTSGQWTQAQFAVLPADAVRSGLQTYAPGSGVREVWLNVSAIYALGERDLLLGFGGVGWFTGDAADRSMVRERGRRPQGLLGLGLSLRF